MLSILNLCGILTDLPTLGSFICCFLTSSLEFRCANILCIYATKLQWYLIRQLCYAKVLIVITYIYFINITVKKFLFLFFNKYTYINIVCSNNRQICKRPVVFCKFPTTKHITQSSLISIRRGDVCLGRIETDSKIGMRGYAKSLGRVCFLYIIMIHF